MSRATGLFSSSAESELFDVFIVEFFLDVYYFMRFSKDLFLFPNDNFFDYALNNLREATCLVIGEDVPPNCFLESILFKLL